MKHFITTHGFEHNDKRSSHNHVKRGSTSPTSRVSIRLLQAIVSRLKHSLTPQSLNFNIETLASKTLTRVMDFVTQLL